MMGEIVIFSLSLITSVFLIVGTSKVKSNELKISLFTVSVVLERRSLYFSVPHHFDLRSYHNHRQPRVSSLAIRSIRAVHGLLLHLHSLIVSTDQRG